MWPISIGTQASSDTSLQYTSKMFMSTFCNLSIFFLAVYGNLVVLKKTGLT